MLRRNMKTKGVVSGKNESSREISQICWGTGGRSKIVSTMLMWKCCGIVRRGESIEIRSGSWNVNEKC